MNRIALVLLLGSLLVGCPAKEPAPPPPEQPTTRNGAVKPPPASDEYTLRFKNWEGVEVDEIVQEMEKIKGFTNWNHRGQSGAFSVYEVTYTGKKPITRQLQQALEDAGYVNNARTDKTGNTLTVHKSN